MPTRIILALMLSLLIQPAFAEENYADLDIDQLRTKAEQGNARAQLVLGVRYEQGQGVFQDHEEAARWYRLAFEQGNASAQIMLYQIDSSVGRRGVTRADVESGRVWNESERVTREQGLKMSTIWAAYYLGDEDTLGSIEPGKLADFVVLDGDYMAVPDDEISDLKTILTVIDGKVVYEVPGEL